MARRFHPHTISTHLDFSPTTPSDAIAAGQEAIAIIAGLPPRPVESGALPESFLTNLQMNRNLTQALSDD